MFRQPSKTALSLLLASGLGLALTAHADPLNFSLDLGGPVYHWVL